MKYRIEKDTLGAVKVENNKYYGAQTTRAINNFKIGSEKYPVEFIKSLAIIKQAAAQTNSELGLLSNAKAKLIVSTCEEIIKGKLNDNFPLTIWHSGSGTQMNMNINEVISNRAIKKTGGKLGSKTPIHPNDDVNMGQSSNDVIPTAMNVTTVKVLTENLIPALIEMRDSLKKKSSEFKDIIKIGRTHLMDATPTTLGNEFSSYAYQIAKNLENINFVLPHLYELAIGGTAVGTGINTHPNFSKKVVAKIAKLTKKPFVSSLNKFEALACHDSLVQLSGTLKTLAVSLMKITGDIRLMASGPRSGFGEIILPGNEPGSSIMPGKINPTQCEALRMVCAQVIGNDTTITTAGALGEFELNVFKPVIMYNIFQSIKLLSDATKSFNDKCLKGIKANRANINKHLKNSLMLVTSLAPKIGYDKAAQVAKKAYAENKTLKEAVMSLGFLNAKEFDKLMNYKDMIRPSNKKKV